MKRVGIAGLLHESNTFLSTPTTRLDFERASLTKGVALIDRWKGSNHELSGFLEGAHKFGFEPLPSLATFAIPSGAIDEKAFEDIVGELLGELGGTLPLDGLLLALHGATVAQNYPDADGEIVRRIRKLIGNDIPIIMTLDLHANVSTQMVAHTTAIVMYRSNPHLDQKQRGLEAAALMARTLSGEIKPVQALECPPLLINISKQYTSQSPALELYDDVREVMTWPGILSASVAMGFYYADVQEMGASFLAVADRDRALAIKASRWLATRAWTRRQDFLGELMTPTEAVCQAAQRVGPVVLMDVGDNVGGGSSANSTVLFAEVLHQRVSNALVILHDPEEVGRCVTAGVRNEVISEIGGKPGDPQINRLRVHGKVRLISDGLFQETQVRHGGWGLNDQGITAVVDTVQGHTIVFTSLRMAPMSLEQLLSLGIKPEQKKILIVKGVVAPRAAYEPIAAEIILVDTPGLTTADPTRFTFRYRRRPVYPIERDATYEYAAASN